MNQSRNKESRVVSTSLWESLCSGTTLRFLWARAGVGPPLDGTVDNCGRICDFDVAGWAGWPEMWRPGCLCPVRGVQGTEISINPLPACVHLWNEAYPWSAIVYETEGEPNGFRADFLPAMLRTLKGCNKLKGGWETVARVR